MSRVAQHVRFFLSSSANISPQSYWCSFTSSVYFKSICCKCISDICLLYWAALLKPNSANHLIKCNIIKRLPGVLWESLAAYPPLTHGVHLRVKGKLQKAGRTPSVLASLLQFLSFELQFWANKLQYCSTKKGKGSCLEPCQMEYGDSSGELAKKMCVCMHVCAQTLYKIKQSLEISPFQEASNPTLFHLPTPRESYHHLYSDTHKFHPDGFTHCFL